MATVRNFFAVADHLGNVFVGGVEKNGMPFSDAVAILPSALALGPVRVAQKRCVALAWALAFGVEDIEAERLGAGATKCVIYCGHEI